MGKSLRMLQLLETLLIRPGITMAEMVEEFGVSERTLYRYLDSLSVDLEVPLYCDKGGYYLSGRPFLGPLNLTSQEMLALTMALRISPASAEPALAGHIKSAMRKIEAAVNSGAMENVKPVLDRSAVQASPYRGDTSPEIMESLLSATMSGKRLLVTYDSARSRKREEILFDPYAVSYRRHAWYAIGHSHQHERVIQLKLVRIRCVVKTGEPFTVPKDFSAEEFYGRSWEVWTGEPEVNVRVRFAREVAPMITEVRRHPSQWIEEQPDGSIIFGVRVAGIREIGSWILGWGSAAEVLEPPELRDELARQAKELTRIYSRNTTDNSL